MKVKPKGRGVAYRPPYRVDGVPLLWGYLTRELTVLGEASFRGESYFAVHHDGDTLFVYKTSWEVVPGTEISLVRETAMAKAERLWPKSKKALREALSFAQFLAQQPQSQPNNAKLIRTLEATLALWAVGSNRALVTFHLERALRPLDR